MLQGKQKTSSELREMLYAEAGGARAQLANLFDVSTFAELGSFVKRTPTELDKMFGCEGDGSEFESVITGYGAVGGRLVFAFAQDFSKMKGALSASHAKKICAVIDSAVKNGAPLIGIFNSAGAVITDGVSALAGYGSIMNRYAQAKGEIPLISVVDGICAGGAAAIAAMGDFICASEKSGIYVNPPFIMKERFKDVKSGTAEKCAVNGLVDISASDENELFASVKSLIACLPSNCGDGTMCDVTNDDSNRLTPEVADILSDSYDVHEIIKIVSDESNFVEIGTACAPEMVCGFISLGGFTVGVAANNPKAGGRLSSRAANKAARFIETCGSFAIPLLTLVDTEGYDVSAESENAPYAAALASLARAYSVSESAKVTVVSGNAYGGAYTLMGSKSLGADVVFALDSAKISAMPADAAAAFIGGDNKTATAKLWADEMASPLAAARDGQIDDIIASEELRQRIISAFEMLSFS